MKEEVSLAQLLRTTAIATTQLPEITAKSNDIDPTTRTSIGVATPVSNK
jgi:hypothetical protein